MGAIQYIFIYGARVSSGLLSASFSDVLDLLFCLHYSVHAIYRVGYAIGYLGDIIAITFSKE